MEKSNKLLKKTTFDQVLLIPSENSQAEETKQILKPDSDTMDVLELSLGLKQTKNYNTYFKDSYGKNEEHTKTNG